METQSRITVEELNNDLKSLFQKIVEVSTEKKYKIDNLDLVEFKLSHLTQSGRKKLARRIKYTNKKNGYRSFNSFFSVLKSKGIIDTRIKVELSDKEKAIQLYRKDYIKARSEAEVLRLKYIEEKGDFYK